MFGAIEAGGTKFICGVGSTPENLRTHSIATTTPDKTLSELADFFKPYRAQLKGVGIGSFGPIDRQRSSPTYGYITSTPKPDWGQTPLLKLISEKLGEDLPLAFDTDVNAAALGEATYGSGQGLDNFVYFTIGTGIGGGIVANSHLVHGAMHAELGHILLPKHPDDHYGGHCPYHKDRCFEGLACGPAISERWSIASAELGSQHPAWDLQAWYMGAALSSLVCTLAPQRIILGGGVMQVKGLIEKVRQAFSEHLQSYMHYSNLKTLENFIVEPGLRGRAGIVGALELIKKHFFQDLIKTK